MNHLDKLIPLAILGVVGAFMFFLLRRAARDKDAGNRSEDSTMRDEVRPQPGKLDQSVAVLGEEPVVAVVQESGPQEESAFPSRATSEREDEYAVAANSVTAQLPLEVTATSKKPTRKKRAPTPVVGTPCVPTPIVSVMGLLKGKNSLAAAFLLREILAPPVSRRQK
jgi:hypothetical protein